MPTTFSEALAARRIHPYSVLLVLLTFAVLVFDGLDIQALGLVAPLIFEDWGIDRSSFGPAMAAALFGMAIGAYVGGTLGDRVGRRNMLIVAALVFGLATVASAYTTNVTAMTAARVLGGLGFGAAFPNSMALANDWVAPRWRAYTVATLSLGVPTGTMISAALAPTLIAAGGWQSVFLTFGGASIALAFIIALCVRESPAYLMERGQIEAAQRAAGIITGPDIELTKEATDTGSVEGTAGEQIGVFHKSNKRMNWGISISFAAAIGVVYGLSSWTPEMLTSSGFTLEQALQASFFIGLFSMIGGFAAGYLSSRFGSRPVMTASTLGTIALVLLLTYLVETISGTPSETLRLIINLTIGIITGVTSVGIATIYIIMANGYPQSCRSGGIGFGMLTGRVGGIAMAFSGGWLLNQFGDSFAAYFAALLAGGVLMIAASAIVDRHVQPA